MSSPVDHVRMLRADYDALSNHDKVRSLRQYAYSRIVLASTSENHLPRDVLTGTLQDVFGAFDRHDGGVWCGGAADILMRVYLEAGFRSWKFEYGAGSPVSHSVTLVQVNGDVYLQDAYFNTDYVREDGRPLPVFEMLDGLRCGHTPRLRQDWGFRKGLFASEANALEWLPAGLDDRPAFETLSPGRVLCHFPMTFEAYRSNYFETAQVTAWLAAAGYPDDWSYLLLHPRRGQRFLTAPPGAFEPTLKRDYDIDLSVTRAVSLPRADHHDPSGPSGAATQGSPTRTTSGVDVRLKYLEGRVVELLEDIVRLVDLNRRARAENERLQAKLAHVREKLARATPRKP